MERTTLTLKQYEALLEHAPILSWKADTEALCDYFNERWLAFRGRSLEEEYGNGWAEGVHPDDFDRCLKTYREAFARREVFEMEYRLKRHDGAYKWIFDLGVPLYNESGEFAGYIGSCIVVADKVDLQEEFRTKMDENAKMLKGIIPCQRMVCNDK